ncbi:MAG: FAD-dependent oxidoreductase [Egibacteraceae bacterium]
MPQRDSLVRVAVVGPLSGTRAAWGGLLTAGIAAVPHAPVRWELFDDRGEVAEAVARAQEVVADGEFAAVVGHFNSMGAREVLPVYRAAGLPALLPLATAPGLLEGMAGTALRLCPDDIGQAAVIARACRERGRHRFTVVHDGSGYGQRLAALVLAAAGPDLSVLVHEVLPEEPIDGAVVFCGVHHRVAELLRREYRPGQGHLVLVTDDCDVPEFAELAGPAASGALVARLAGGAPGRVAAAFAALAGALAKHPGHRGSALLDAVRGELADELGHDGDPVGGSSGAGWEIVPVPPRTGHHGAAHRRSGVERRYDVAVVGGGVVGLATAAELAEAGARVALLDAGSPGSSASAVSGALVRAFELAVRAEKPVAFVRKAPHLAALLRTTSTRRDPRGVLRLARRAQSHPQDDRGRPPGPPHRQRSFRLGPLSEREGDLALRGFQLLWGRPELAVAYGFHRTGGLVLLGADHLDAAATGVTALRAAGVTAELLTVGELAQRWPDLDSAGLAGAVWEPDAGYVVPAVALATLLDRARRAGAAVLPSRRVRGLAAGPEGMAVLDDGAVRAEVVVVAAGCATPELLGERWPADRPARTKRIRYGIFERGGRRLPTVVDLTTGMWGRPDGRDGFLAGHPVEEWDVPVTAGTELTGEQVEWIRAGAGQRLPFLVTAGFLAGRFGTDLYVPGGPVLGVVPGTPRTVVAAGWSGAGFKTAPAAAARAATAALGLLGEGGSGATSTGGPPAMLGGDQVSPTDSGRSVAG